MTAALYTTSLCFSVVAENLGSSQRHLQGLVSGLFAVVVNPRPLGQARPEGSGDGWSDSEDRDESACEEVEPSTPNASRALTAIVKLFKVGVSNRYSHGFTPLPKVAKPAWALQISRLPC